MTKKIINQFNKFIESIDEKNIELIGLNDKRLTKKISEIQDELWVNYKNLNGTSAGFHGLSEYIVFSIFKKFIEKLNNPNKFEPKELTKDTRFFEIHKNSKTLSIYRSSKLKYQDSYFNRRPDIIVSKKENGCSRTLVVVEIKNYLDKSAANSAIKMLSSIKEFLCKKNKKDNTKYVLFSFGKVSVSKETMIALKKFQEQENNFVITNEKDSEKFVATDLSELFDIIKEDLVL